MSANQLEHNKALIRRWFEEVWNQGRPEAVSEMMSEDCINHGLSEDGQPILGASGFLPIHTQIRGAFPNIHLVVEDAIAEGDRVAVRCSVKGLHTGDHLGFPATNKHTEFNGIAIARVKDGMFVESWNSFDFMTMYKQLGVR